MILKKFNRHAAFFLVHHVLFKMKTENEKQFIQLIDGCQRGNLNSQRSLYEQFYGYGLSIALRYAYNREEAVEILNDAFL